MSQSIYRTAADAITEARYLANGAIVGSLLTAPPEDQRSWGRATAYAITSLADGLDGWIARKDPNGTSTEGAKFDHETDKKASYLTLSSIAFINREPLAAVELAVDLVRDRIVGKKRADIELINQDPQIISELAKPIETKARGLGKIKTAWKDLTNTAALSPFGEKYPNAIKIARLGGIVLSVASGVDFIRQANSDIDAAMEKQK